MENLTHKENSEVDRDRTGSGVCPKMIWGSSRERHVEMEIHVSNAKFRNTVSRGFACISQGHWVGVDLACLCHS